MSALMDICRAAAERPTYKELKAENARLRAAIINLLDDGDETDRAEALKLVRPNG